MPLKGKNMGDVKENAMQILQSIDYLRGLKDGNSGIIPLDNIFYKACIVRKDIPSNDDFNNIITNGVYNIVEPKGANNPGIDYGVLLVFGDIFYVQIAFNYFGSPVYRLRDNNGNWKKWNDL